MSTTLRSGTAASTASPSAAWARLRAIGPVNALCLAVVLFFAVAALWPSLLAPGDPLAVDIHRAAQPPSWDHVLGTDQSGRDLYTRIVHGARPSLLIGLGATTLALSLAVLLGLLSGLGGRLVDLVVGRLLEVAFAFPVLLLALLLVAVRGPSVTTLVIAVGVGSAPGYARMVRGQVLAVRGQPYVEAAHALGHRPTRVVVRHVLPNALRPLLAMFTLGVGQSIVWASGLAFLGLGVAPPSPEWGALLEGGRLYVTTSWWIEVMPGLAIVSVALAVTTLGRAVRRRLEGAQA
ncbi:ABC transporter permease [Streptomyces profundus]|uniref:ABC transporter permease n=1 Tax=Streptomyces profundus TaxID=2867410 RepID=UPI001D162BF3|nr:ABC transporter permease [Streptomyces sp. MA3_2.13]UED87326.1 ABC transporter permease [Streptomyces sp. MA3_2.13]